MNLRLSHVFRFLLINCVVCGALIVVFSFFRKGDEPAFFVWVAPLFVAFVYVIINTFIYVMLHAFEWNNRILNSWGGSVIYAVMPLAVLSVFMIVASDTMINEGIGFILMYLLPAFIAIAEQWWYKRRKKPGSLERHEGTGTL